MGLESEHMSNESKDFLFWWDEIIESPSKPIDAVLMKDPEPATLSPPPSTPVPDEIPPTQAQLEHKMN